MRALIRHGQCRIKSDPEPEMATNNSMTSSLLNGNIRDPNQVHSTLDIERLDMGGLLCYFFFAVFNVFGDYLVILSILGHLTFSGHFIYPPASEASREVY